MTVDIALSGPAWRLTNVIADRISPMLRGRFFVALGAALEQHFAEPGVSRAVGLELALCDAICALSLHDIEPIDTTRRPA